jgi:GTP pyrophosphokinase
MCLRPRGPVELPQGATVIDFSYRIRSEIGHHCSGARVNGQLVPFKYILRNSDTVRSSPHTSQPSAIGSSW